MCNQVLPQQDFFIYIPEAQGRMKFPAMKDTGFITGHVKDRMLLPPTPSDWVKIPLEGLADVYAYIWDAEDRVERSQ